MIARFDELFERRYPSATAAQLTAIGELFTHRLARCSETLAAGADRLRTPRAP